VAGGAGAIASTGVVELDSVVERDIENRLLFAMIFVGQLAVLKRDRLAFGKEGDLNGVGVVLAGGCVDCRRSGAV